MAWLENLRADGIKVGEASTTTVTWKDRKTDSVRGQDPLIYKNVIGAHENYSSKVSTYYQDSTYQRFQNTGNGTSST